MGQTVLADIDISKFVVSKRELVTFECLLSEVPSVVAVLLKHATYRSLNGYC